MQVSFFFNDTATTEIYTLSLHDALPISNLAAEATPSWLSIRSSLQISSTNSSPCERCERVNLNKLRRGLLPTPHRRFTRCESPVRADITPSFSRPIFRSHTDTPPRNHPPTE